MAATTRDRGRGRSGPDPVSVILVSLAAFFCVLALLAHQVRASDSVASKRPKLVVVRRIYQTTVVETVPGTRPGTSVSQSTSGSGTSAVPAAPATRASG